MRIASIDVIPLLLPFRGVFRTSRGTVGSSAEGRTVVLVRLTTDDGVVGWGEASPSRLWSYETHHSVVTTLRHYLAPALLGHDAFDIDGAHSAIDRVIAPGATTGQPIARAGIDLALHDAVGKALGVPVHRLWGMCRADHVTLSWTVGGSTLDAVERAVAEGRERGYRHFNFKVGTDPAFDVALCRRLRALAPEAFLWADANGGYTAEIVVRQARLLQDAGADLLEQPLPGSQPAGWAELRRAVDLPISVDESICAPADLVQFLRAGAITGFTGKVTRAGGLLPARRCFDIAEGAGLALYGSGLTDAGIALAAGAHLYGAYGLRRPCALNGPQYLLDDVVCSGLRIEGDRLHVPAGPGLGVVVDEEKVARYRVEM